MADNLGLIIDLLQDAFDAEGIAQLAFADFRAVYDDFTSGMTKSQQIRMIVDAANRNGRIPDLLYYVQTHNPFMFQKHAERLALFYELPHERSEEEKLATYLAWVERQYGSLHVLDMGRERPLKDVYTAVELLDKPEAYRHLDIETLQQNKGAEKRFDGLLLIKSEKRLFVQGGPGVGKTTFLKHLALESARQDGQLPFVPIFVDLQMLADADKDLFGFVVDEFAIGGFSDAVPFVQRCVQSGRLLLLLDGLDELPVEDGQRKRVEQKIEQFVRQQQNQNCHIVLTCRTAAEHGRFKQFAYVQVATFDAAQVNKFVSGWFHADENKKSAMLAVLANAENSGIKDLTQTPLLLALLCMAAEDSADTVLFERRADIYQKAFDVLLHHWDDDRGIKRDAFYRNMTAERKQQMLATIAYETFSKSEKLIPLGRLQGLLRAYLATLPDAPPGHDIPDVAVLQALIAQHGIFVERSRGIYAFAHLSFQEYFTAKYIVDNAQNGVLDQLLIHVVEDKWREVILLTASLLNSGDDFFDKFIGQLDILIADADSIQLILLWAKDITVQAKRNVQLEYKSTACRAWYLDLALSRFLARFFSIDLALDLARNLDRDLARDLDLALALALSRNLARILAIDWDHDRYLDFDLAQDIDLALTLAKKTSLELNLHDVYYVLQTLTIKIRGAAQVDWDAFTIELERVIVSYNKFSRLAYLRRLDAQDKDLRKSIDWDAEQINLFADYMKGTVLLVDCLKLAKVADQEGIEARLLLPAAQGNGS